MVWPLSSCSDSATVAIAIIAEAFTTVKPACIITVPLIIEKIIRKNVFPKIQNNRMRLLLNMPVVSKKVKSRICNEVYNAFGGNLYEVIVGGAPLSKEVEEFLLSIGFPITVGYGTTECAPLISFSDYHDFIGGSVGQPVDRMEVKILSSDPQNVAGEIVTKGTNMMLGYYLNEEATFIRGRSKNMLLGANGQNVYPEEIEDKLNTMAMVSESIVIQRGEKLVALVHPDQDEVVSFSQEELEHIMEQNRQELNNMLPAYSRISAIELHEEEFAKTPKKSIKRYLYKNN